jgi:casein kinase 1
VHRFGKPQPRVELQELSFTNVERSIRRRARPRALNSYPMASSSSNVVGVHYRVGKKIGEGSFGVIFEGTNLLNNQQVAIKFVRLPHCINATHKCVLHIWRRHWISRSYSDPFLFHRNLERAMLHNCETSIEHIKFLSAAVSIPGLSVRAIH